MKFFQLFFMSFMLALITPVSADTVDDLLRGTSDELNKTISGMQVDQVTQLQGTFYQNFGKREFIYIYTITDGSLTKDSFDWEIVKDRVIQNFCTDPELKVFLDLTTISSRYNGLDGSFFYEFNFSKKECKGGSNDKYSSSTPNIATINIGGEAIKIVSPNGYDIETRQDVVDLFIDSFSSDRIRFRVLIIPESESDLDKGRSMAIATVPKFENKITQKRYSDFIDILVEQQQTLMDKATTIADKTLKKGFSNINNKYGTEMKVEVQDMSSLGAFISEKDVTSLAAIVDGEIYLEGGYDRTPQIVSMSVLRIKDRLVSAYVYSNYSTESDIAWVKSKTREFVNLLLKSNN